MSRVPAVMSDTSPAPCQRPLLLPAQQSMVNTCDKYRNPLSILLHKACRILAMPNPFSLEINYKPNPLSDT